MKNINEEAEILQNNFIQEGSPNQVINNNNIIQEQSIRNDENNNLTENFNSQEKIKKNEKSELAGNEMDIDIELNKHNIEEKKEKTTLTRLPIAKIKNIIKLDNEIKLCQKDVYTVIGKITELFLEDLASSAYNICKSYKRKTMNLEDINSAIRNNPKMGFINFNSIFCVQELNKVKKRPVTTPKIINKNINNEENNLKTNEVKDIKRRGKSNIKTDMKNNTLDSLFRIKK